MELDDLTSRIAAADDLAALDARGVQFLNTQSLGMKTRADLVCTP